MVTEHPWSPDHVLVLHSDGVTTHWGWNDLPDLMEGAAPDLARELLRKLAKETDDATVIVVKEATP